MSENGKRILLLMDNLGVGGGTETAVVQLIPELKNRGFDVEIAVLYQQPFENMSDSLRKSGLLVFDIGLASRRNVFHAAWKIKKLSSQRGYDLIHARLYYPASALATARMFFGIKPALIASLHSMVYEMYPPKSLFQSLQKNIFAYLLRNHIDSVMANSIAVANHLKSHLRLKQVQVIWNTLREIPRLDLSAPKNERIRNYSIVFSVPARLEPFKGHGVLLDAVKIVKERGFDPFFYLIGEGSLEKKLAADIEERGLSGNIKLTGLLPHREALRIASECDAVLLPSPMESFPMSLLEAQFLGKPCIAGRVGGIPEIMAFSTIHPMRKNWLKKSSK
jgi:glycosyltransferase involved in cell wall biosynthesis